MRTDLEIALDFLLSAAADEPLNVRFPVLRTAAEWCGNEMESRRLRLIASDLETADQRCREFRFQFTDQRTAKTK